MKRLFLISLLIAIPASCWGQMTPHYDSYTTYSLDSNLKIYQTVVVEGYTIGSCFYACGPNNQQCEFSWCSSATHTPKINNVIGGVGGWSTGGSVSPFSYLSYQTTSSVQGVVGQQYSATTEGDVFCSAAGQMFGVIGNPIIGGAYTKEVWIGGQLQGFCAVTRACNNTATPLCAAPSVYVGNASCSPAWDAYWITVKIGTGPTQCFPAFSLPTSDISAEWCTPAP